MEKKKIWKDESVQAGVLILAAFLLLTAWAFMQPLGAGPDEKMRYMVAQYLHKHPGKLPLGDDPAIRDATWGISYAYYPILSYMVSAVFIQTQLLLVDTQVSIQDLQQVNSLE